MEENTDESMEKNSNTPEGPLFKFGQFLFGLFGIVAGLYIAIMVILLVADLYQKIPYTSHFFDSSMNDSLGRAIFKFVSVLFIVLSIFFFSVLLIALYVLTFYHSFRRGFSAIVAKEYKILLPLLFRSFFFPMILVFTLPFGLLSSKEGRSNIFNGAKRGAILGGILGYLIVKKR